MTQRTDMEKMRTILDNLPADSSFDEILQEIGLHRSIERGIADAEAGRVFSHEDVGKWIASLRDGLQQQADDA